MSTLREQLLAAFSNSDFATASYYLRNCTDRTHTAVQVRAELERMERDGLVRKYRPWCRANQLYWQLVDRDNKRAATADCMGEIARIKK